MRREIGSSHSSLRGWWFEFWRMVVDLVSDLKGSPKEPKVQSRPILNPHSKESEDLSFEVPNGQKIHQGVIQPKNFPSLPADWVSEWETFPSSDGKLQLFAVNHHPKEWKSERILVVLHGL